MSMRHINPKGLHRSPAFSQAVVVEQPTKTIYIGGQNGVDADGKVVGPGVAAFQQAWNPADPPPAITVHVVAGLAPGFLVEIDAVAVV
jgi:enamine deaminase RidA (YjgF/YER057c/UK114 family)